ncbi:MAG: hypothetical protein FH758_13555 [Firmicutes bacterium]|nr:hypothetical protein [Bacillota bacterium]
MIQILSWLIVISIGLHFATYAIAPLSPSLFPVIMLIPLGLGGISAVGLVICLILERLNERDEEKDVISKY